MRRVLFPLLWTAALAGGLMTMGIDPVRIDLGVMMLGIYSAWATGVVALFFAGRHMDSMAWIERAIKQEAKYTLRAEKAYARQMESMAKEFENEDHQHEDDLKPRSNGADVNYAS